MKAPTSVYFGGGTPSAISPQSLSKIYEKLARVGNFLNNAMEQTIECNPDDLTEALLTIYREMGFNRLSLGLQTFSNKALQKLHRRHDVHTSHKAVRMARKAGFKNLSLDIIYGLPDVSTPIAFKQELDELLSLEPEHISAYHLTVQPNTALWKQQERGTFALPKEEVSQELYSILCEELAKGGYYHYEVSNFARKGREAIHNRNYWEEVPYVGLGAGAHSYNGTDRRLNTDEIESYLKEPLNSFSWDRLSPIDRYNEYVMKRFRLARGIALQEIEQLFPEQKNTFLAGYEKNRTFHEFTPQGNIRIKETDWLLCDTLLTDYFSA